MYTDNDPVRTCAQAIQLFFRTVGAWLRVPLRRSTGVVFTLGAAVGALVLFVVSMITLRWARWWGSARGAPWGAAGRMAAWTTSFRR